MKIRLVLIVVLLTAVVSSAGMLNNPKNRFKLELDYEIGFTGVIFHTIQFGQTGTVLNYVKDGGQDVSFHIRHRRAEHRQTYGLLSVSATHRSVKGSA